MRLDKLSIMNSCVMKLHLFALLWILLVVLNCPAEEMNASSIKQLVEQIDDSLPRGNIYHINYSVTDKRTDAFYDHCREIIKLMQDNHAEMLRNIRTTHPSGETPNPEQDVIDMENSFKHHLSHAREFNYTCDYNLDGIGFYMKQKIDFIDAKGQKTAPATTIYASDGKIMGTFYLDDSQAVIQPATERPQVPEEHWTNLAYLFSTDKVSHIVELMTTLKVTQNDTELVITGERPGQLKELTQLELRIDKSSFRPLTISTVYYGSMGRLFSKDVKTWQYQDFSGISLPKVVVDQSYQTDVSGKLNLEQERTFTINDFSPGVKSSKESFKGLLKSSYSIYDEITGSHYISGNPEEMLDKLSR